MPTSTLPMSSHLARSDSPSYNGPELFATYSLPRETTTHDNLLPLWRSERCHLDAHQTATRFRLGRALLHQGRVGSYADPQVQFTTDSPTRSIESAGQPKHSPTTFVGGLEHLPVRYAMRERTSARRCNRC